MKRAIKAVTLADVLFLLLLVVSGLTKGVLADIIYYSAFLLPVLIALAAEKDRLNKESLLRPLKISTEAALTALPTVAPTLLLVILTSYMTTIAFGALGYENEVVLEGNLIGAILNYALLPSILEELLFRYLPLVLIAPYSKRTALLVSSVVFATAHCDLFTIPYALIAGAAFMCVDMLTGSIAPSVIIHFLNNLCSVVFYFYPDSQWLAIVYLVLLTTLSTLSVVFVFKRREKYKSEFGKMLVWQDSEGEMGIAPLVFILPTLFMAFLNLVGS